MLQFNISSISMSIYNNLNDKHISQIYIGCRLQTCLG